MALVVMRHGATTSLLQRQARLGTVERLDLALLIHRKHQRLVRRIEIQADDVLHLLGKALVVRQLEAFPLMRLELVRLPDPLHTAIAEAIGLRVLQWVARGGFSCRVLCTTCWRVAALSGGL